MNNNKLKRFIKNKKAIIFDMDGTILNSEPLHEAAIFEIIKILKLDVNIKDRKTLIGISDFFIYKQFILPNTAPDKRITFDGFVKLKNSIIINLLNDIDENTFNKLFTPGLKKLLNFLQEEKKLICLVSASEKEIVEAIVKKAKLSNFFIIQKSRSDTFNSKPSPSPYINALRELRLKASEILIFEDSQDGVSSALASGAETIQVTAFSPKCNFSTLTKVQNFY